MTPRTQRRKSLRSEAKRIAETCSAWNARAAARRITRFFDRRLAPAGLGIAQLGLMAEIASAADDRLGGLAERMGLDQSTLSRNLRVLESDQLVEIATAERDLRRRAVWLTEKGVRKLEAALPLWRAAQDALARLVDAATIREIALATRGLDRDPDAA
jgi:DNA-binding MarR family transcriptional regulator